MTSHDDRFRSRYAEHFDALLAYALCRVDQPSDAADAADVVACGCTGRPQGAVQPAMGTPAA